MANSAKYTRAACGHIAKHFERAKDDNGNYIKFTNQNIDLSRTHLNYNLATHQQSQLDFIKNRCSEVHCLNRQNVNVMCSWCVTQPKDFPMEQSRDFFEQTYKFLENRYGKDNVISAYVHMDETTPHMHFAFVPITMDRKKNRLTVSAKNVLSKTELQVFHKNFSKAMENYFGYDIGVHTDITAEQGGHKTIKELQKETTILEKHKCNLENDLQTLKGKVLKQQEVNAIQGKKSFTGALKNVSYEEYLSLKKTAMQTNAVKSENKSLKSKIDTLSNKLDTAIQRAEKAENDRTEKFTLEKIKELNEKEEYKRQINILKKALHIPEQAKSNEIKQTLQQLGLLEVNKTKNQSRGFSR